MSLKTVLLNDTETELVDRLVSSGRYPSAGDAMRAGLRLLEREENDLQELRARLTTGIEQARSGDLADGDGEQAIRRAFAAARARCPNPGS